MNKRIKSAVFLTVILVANIAVPLTKAASIKAILHTNEKYVISDKSLERDENGSLYVCSVLNTSKYKVKANYGTKDRERTKGFVEPGKHIKEDISWNEYRYTNCKVILYGYSQADPRKECYATGIISSK